MLYILVLEPFLLRVNPVLHKPGTSEVARYFTYADDISALVTSSVEVSKEIGRYKVVIYAKINCNKLMCLGSWKN